MIKTNPQKEHERVNEKGQKMTAQGDVVPTDPDGKVRDTDGKLLDVDHDGTLKAHEPPVVPEAVVRRQQEAKEDHLVAPDEEAMRVQQRLGHPRQGEPGFEPPVRSRRAQGGNYVVDPSGMSGELHHNGRSYKAGERVQLSEEEAEEIGAVVRKVQ